MALSRLSCSIQERNNAGRRVAENDHHWPGDQRRQQHPHGQVASTPSGERNLGIPSFGGGGGHRSRLGPGQICAAVSGTCVGVPRRLFRRYQPSMTTTALSVPSPVHATAASRALGGPQSGPADSNSSGTRQGAGGRRKQASLYFGEQATVVGHRAGSSITQ